MTKIPTSFSSQAGMSLIEVLVSMLIMAIGILGVIGLQVASIRYQNIAKSRGIAAQYAYDISDRVRANPQSRGTDIYATSVDINPSVTCVVPSACTPEEAARKDLLSWQKAVASGLPNGSARMSYDGKAKTYTATISWNEQRGVSTDTGTQSFDITFLP